MTHTTTEELIDAVIWSESLQSYAQRVGIVEQALGVSARNIPGDWPDVVPLIESYQRFAYRDVLKEERRLSFPLARLAGALKMVTLHRGASVFDHSRLLEGIQRLLSQEPLVYDSMAPRVFDVVSSMRSKVQSNTAYFIWVIVLQIEAVSGPAAAAIMAHALERALGRGQSLTQIYWAGNDCFQALIRIDRTKSEMEIVSRFFI